MLDYEIPMTNINQSMVIAVVLKQLNKYPLITKKEYDIKFVSLNYLL